ncbi:MAG TPA: DinB family protein [Bryobacteraceae bacterium]|nr:DinB family protein [Bryobacteraceae bacterium]
MTDSEKEFATKQLLEGREAVVRAIDGLTDTQLQFKPQPDGWSIADCVEHLAVTEDMLFALVTKGAPNPDGVSLDPVKDGRMAAAVVDRSRRFSAPHGVRPHGHFVSPAEAVAHFRESRERALAYTRDCTHDLRRLFTPHPLLGEIDCYRCLLLLALHPARHAAQIEEIKQHAQFPEA